MFFREVNHDTLGPGILFLWNDITRNKKLGLVFTCHIIQAIISRRRQEVETNCFRFVASPADKRGNVIAQPMALQGQCRGLDFFHHVVWHTTNTVRGGSTSDELFLHRVPYTKGIILPRYWTASCDWIQSDIILRIRIKQWITEVEETVNLCREGTGNIAGAVLQAKVSAFLPGTLEGLVSSFDVGFEKQTGERMTSQKLSKPRVGLREIVIDVGINLIGFPIGHVDLIPEHVPRDHEGPSEVRILNTLVFNRSIRICIILIVPDGQILGCINEDFILPGNRNVPGALEVLPVVGKLNTGLAVPEELLQANVRGVKTLLAIVEDPRQEVVIKIKYLRVLQAGAVESLAVTIEVTCCTQPATRLTGCDTDIALQVGICRIGDANTRFSRIRVTENQRPLAEKLESCREGLRVIDNSRLGRLAPDQFPGLVVDFPVSPVRIPFVSVRQVLIRLGTREP